MNAMDRISKKINLSYLLSLISSGLLGIISMAMLAGAVVNAPNNIRLLILIGQIISFIGIIVFSVRIKFLKADRDVIFNCYLTITAIENIITQIKNEFDFNTPDGEKLFDVVVDYEYKIRNIISKMGRCNSHDLKFSIHFDLNEMLVKLRLYQMLFSGAKKGNTKKYTVNNKTYNSKNAKYLKILGLTSTVTDWDTIKSNYRQLVKKYHTDVNSSSNAEELIKEINVAYGELEKQFA